MANENNLIPNSERTPSELREMRSNGGKKSGEARRRKKALKSLMNDLLSSEVFDTSIYNKTTAMGISPEEMSYGAAIVAAMVKEAAEGNVKAFNAITDLIGEGSSGERVKLQRRQVKLQENKASTDSGNNGRLADLIEGLKDDVYEETTDTASEVAEE